MLAQQPGPAVSTDRGLGHAISKTGDVLSESEECGETAQLGECEFVQFSECELGGAADVAVDAPPEPSAGGICGEQMRTLAFAGSCCALTCELANAVLGIDVLPICAGSTRPEVSSFSTLRVAVVHDGALPRGQCIVRATLADGAADAEAMQDAIARDGPSSKDAWGWRAAPATRATWIYAARGPRRVAELLSSGTIARGTCVMVRANYASRKIAPSFWYPRIVKLPDAPAEDSDDGGADDGHRRRDRARAAFDDIVVVSDARVPICRDDRDGIVRAMRDASLDVADRAAICVVAPLLSSESRPARAALERAWIETVVLGPTCRATELTMDRRWIRVEQPPPSVDAAKIGSSSAAAAAAPRGGRRRLHRCRGNAAGAAPDYSRHLDVRCISSSSGRVLRDAAFVSFVRSARERAFGRIAHADSDDADGGASDDGGCGVAPGGMFGTAHLGAERSLLPLVRMPRAARRSSVEYLAAVTARCCDGFSLAALRVIVREPLFGVRIPLGEPLPEAECFVPPPLATAATICVARAVPLCRERAFADLASI